MKIKKKSKPTQRIKKRTNLLYEESTVFSFPPQEWIICIFYLQSKISKRAWVLHECLERVPENIDAMTELLQYGLHGTDLPALLAVGRGEDGGRYNLTVNSLGGDEVGRLHWGVRTLLRFQTRSLSMLLSRILSFLLFIGFCLVQTKGLW